MKNWIKPFSKQFDDSKDEDLSRNESLDKTIDILFKNLKSDVENGSVRVNNMADLSKLMNVQTLLDERKLRDEVPEEEFNVFDDVLDELEGDKAISIDKLYEMAFDKYNKFNDDKNKEDKE